MELRNFFTKKEIKDTAQNEQDFYQKTPRKKFLKIFAAASLALITSATTLLATAPFGTGAASAATNSNLSNNTQTTTNSGLITPQEDDPVLFKTESGLEIKVANASDLTNENLENFFYITTESDSTKYYWIIIGQNLSTGSGLPSLANDLKTTYMLNTVLDNTVAGRAILGEFLSSTAKYNNSEIPANSILCLANDVVATGPYNTTLQTYSSSWKHYGSTYRSTENIKVAMEDYYNNGSFGLSSIRSKILAIDLTTYTYTRANSQVGWITDNCTQQHVYPLGSHANSSFFWEDYLKSDQIKLSSVQFLRGNAVAYCDGSAFSGSQQSTTITPLDTNGTLNSSYYAHSTCGYRPAFCLSLV